MLLLKIMTPPVKLPLRPALFWHERFRRGPANRRLRCVYIEHFGD